MMFLKMRKLTESLGKKSTQEDGALESENLDEDVAEAGAPVVNQVTSLEELVNKRTRDLEEAREQLKQLSDSTDGSEEKDEAEVEELFTAPNQPKGESSDQPKAEQAGEEEDTLPEKADAEPKAPENEQKSEPENEPGNEGEGDSLSDLFSQEEEEENPLAGLISTLPDVTAKELLDEVQEIKVMLSEWQQS